LSIPVQPQTIAELEEARAGYVREISRAYSSMTSESSFPENRASYAQVIKACIKLVKFADKEIKRLEKAQAAAGKEGSA
jgi:hypothetical protein